jgi:hypothetical protein
MSLCSINAVAEERLPEISTAPLPHHAMQALSFVYDEQDIPAPLNERMNDTNHAVTSRLNTNSLNHYTSAIPHNINHFPFQHITAFRADMTWRLETLEAHALNFDQRLNTICQGIATLNERSTTATQYHLLESGYCRLPPNQPDPTPQHNRRELHCCRREITTISRSLTALNERSATG